MGFNAKPKNLIRGNPLILLLEDKLTLTIEDHLTQLGLFRPIKHGGNAMKIKAYPLESILYKFGSKFIYTDGSGTDLTQYYGAYYLQICLTSKLVEQLSPSFDDKVTTILSQL